MSHVGRVVRLGAIGGALVSLLLGLAAPVSATPKLSTDSVATTGQSGDHLYSATLTVDVGPAVGPSVIFEVSCQATATPDASATSITECGGAPAASSPGDVAFTQAAFSGGANSAIQLCVAGFATYVETLLGDVAVSGPRACTTVILTPSGTAPLELGLISEP
jgi:hypothetical protein